METETISYLIISFSLKEQILNNRGLGDSPALETELKYRFTGGGGGGTPLLGL